MPVTGSKTLNTYRLSIRAYAGGFSFSVINLLDGTLMRQEDIAIRDGEVPAQVLLHMLQRPRLTHYHYTSVELQSDAPATVVPLELFKRDDVTSLYRLNFPQSTARRNEICYEMLPSLEVVVIYALDMDVRNTIVDMYPDAVVRCTHSVNIERAYQLSRKGDTGRIEFYAFVDAKQLTVCAFQQGSLHFACTYDAKQDSDRIYFLLGAWKTLAMDNEVDVCHVSGLSQQMADDLSRYISKIEQSA